jgi:predicted NUDIX family NTP pyrophosphohydrolase
MYRWRAGELQLLLVHPGGPFWRGKDAGAWMIPKGGVEAGEEPADAARREFEEELGTKLEGPLTPLGRIRQAGGKWVEAFALEGDLDVDRIVSNHFSLEYPPRSGRFQSFPEVDAAAWFTLPEARAKMLASQLPLLDAVERLAVEAATVTKPA